MLLPPHCRLSCTCGYCRPLLSPREVSIMTRGLLGLTLTVSLATACQSFAATGVASSRAPGFVTSAGGRRGSFFSINGGRSLPSRECAAARLIEPLSVAACSAAQDENGVICYHLTWRVEPRPTPPLPWYPAGTAVC